MDWFARQDRHEYVLIHPGPRVRVERIAPRVRVVQVFGVPAYRRTGYRLLVDYKNLQRLLRECEPDVLETGDPWFSGPMGLVLRKRRQVRGLVTSFFHTDPLTSYLVPLDQQTDAGVAPADAECVSTRRRDLLSRAAAV